MVGNVWQWTDEYVDDHTRGGILRGGSYYQPQGSIWYFPQAYRNDQHGKLLLMAPSYDRSGTLGFRCVKDMEKQSGACDSSRRDGHLTRESAPCVHRRLIGLGAGRRHSR